MAEEATKGEVAAPEPTKDIAEEKAVVPVATPAPEDSKALVVVDNSEQPAATRDSNERDAYLAKVANEKMMTLIKAWEESEKARAENKAAKKLSNITSWEVAKKAEMEADLKKNEEELEKKKAEFVEKLKNKVAMIHRSAEEKRAMVEATRGEDVIKVEEMAAKYRAKGEAPKRLFGLLKA